MLHGEGDCSQCLSNNSATELDSTSSQQNASPRIWQYQRRCTSDTGAVISAAHVHQYTVMNREAAPLKLVIHKRFKYFEK